MGKSGALREARDCSCLQPLQWKRLLHLLQGHTPDGDPPLLQTPWEPAPPPLPFQRQKVARLGDTEEGGAQEGTGQGSQHNSPGQGMAEVQVPGENKVCPERASSPSLTPIVSASLIGRERQEVPFLSTQGEQECYKLRQLKGAFPPSHKHRGKKKGGGCMLLAHYFMELI